METVSGIVEEDEENPNEEDKPVVQSASDKDTSVVPSEEDKAPTASDKATSAVSPEVDKPVAPNSATADSRQTPQPKDLVNQGISFLSGLVATLKSPEATAQLVDSIVEKDEKTGETSIKIPVESKETVSDLLNLIGKLFAK